MNAVFKDGSPAIRFKEFEKSWTFKSLNCFALKVSKKNIELDEHRVLTNSARDGIVLQQHFFDKEIGKLENLTGYYKVEINDFVYNPRISKYASAGPVNRNKLTEGVVSPLYTVFRFFMGNLDFLEQYLKSTKWHRHIKKIANYGARFDRMNITNSDFFTLPIPLIEELEQKKIASFLSSVDRRIEQLDRKKSLLEEYRKGMMQKLFSRKIRFRDEWGKEYPEWALSNLGSVFSERIERGCSGEKMLSVTISSGVVLAKDLDRRDKSSIDKSKYKKVTIGDITYNSMRMWQGASGVSNYVGIVSPAYTVIVPNDDQVPAFWGHYFKLARVKYIFQRYSQGLTSDTWNLKYPALSGIKLHLPVSEEQQKIALFLSSIDRKIDLVSAQIEKTREFKRGLLQQMFV